MVYIHILNMWKVVFIEISQNSFSSKPTPLFHKLAFISLLCKQDTHHTMPLIVHYSTLFAHDNEASEKNNIHYDIHYPMQILRQIKGVRLTPRKALLKDIKRKKTKNLRTGYHLLNHSTTIHLKTERQNMASKLAG